MIDTTRNLPTFAEQYQATKNKNILAPAINSAVDGFDTERKFQLEKQKQAAESGHLAAQNKYYEAEGADKAADALKKGVEAKLLGQSDMPVDWFVANNLIDQDTAMKYKTSGITHLPVKQVTDVLNAKNDTTRTSAVAALDTALGQAHKETAAAQTSQATTAAAAQAATAANQGKLTNIAQKAADTKAAADVLTQPNVHPTPLDTPLMQGARKLGNALPINVLHSGPTPFEAQNAAKGQANKVLLQSSITPADATAAAPAMPTVTPPAMSTPAPGDSSTTDTFHTGDPEADRVIDLISNSSLPPEEKASRIATARQRANR